MKDSRLETRLLTETLPEQPAVPRRESRRDLYAIASKPTRWKGFACDSKLERAWATVLAASWPIVIPQPREFEIIYGKEAGPYTCDFYVSINEYGDPHFYAEVKPDMRGVSDRVLFRRMRAFKRESGLRVMPLRGLPTVFAVTLLWEAFGDGSPANVDLIERVVRQARSEYAQGKD